MFFSHNVPDDEEDYNTFIPLPRDPPVEPEADSAPRSRRPTVEEVPDEDDPQNFRRFPEPFSGQGEFPGYEDFVKASEKTLEDLKKGKTVFEAMKAAQDAAGLGPHAPFLDGEEWELAS
jgi:hypothetical protein